jgi:oligoendopeptidase F
MTAEDLVAKFLNEDITKPDFWLKGLALVKSQVDEFHKAWGE